MDSSLSFRRGDIVQLKSSDRRMMVDEVEDSTIVCRWYEGREKRVDRFYSEALHHYQMKISNSEAIAAQRG